MELWVYIIIAVIWLAIVFGWLVPVIKKRMIGEIYMACGLGIFFTIIVLGAMVVGAGDISPLVYLGWAFYVPAAAFVIPSFISLKHKGKPESGWEPTTELIESGVYRIVRHPLYLGSAIFTLGLMLIFQSIVSTILGLVAIFCFWMASRKEDAFNIEKFGDAYKEYMKRVPMWNVFKIIFARGGSHG
jgi:protein-S-isoprenylcysteine O-methyltransferase Ste14